MDAPPNGYKNTLMLAVPTAVPLSLMSLASAVSYAQILSSSARGTISGGYLATASFFSMAGEAYGTRLGSLCPFTMSCPDMTVTLFLGRMLQSVADADLGEAAQPTAVVALHVGSMICGLTFFFLGKVRAVTALNYLPYPVIAGFLAMIGAAVVKAALGLLHPADGQTTLPLPIGLAMASTALGLKLYGVPSNFSSVVMIILSLVIFYGWAFLAEKPMDTLREEGWLLPAGSGAAGPFEIFQVDLFKANWRFAIPSIHALALLMVASIMRALTLTAIESACAITPYSVESEMARLGVVSVCVGCLGGIAMNASSGQSTLAKEGSQDDAHVARCASLTVVLIELGVWISGFPLTAFLPKFLLGGLLLLMGGGMIVDWAWLVNRKLQWTGVAVIYGMLAVSLKTSLTTGIGLGVVFALVLTHGRFAQLEVLKYHVSGVHFRSGQIYDAQQRDLLRAHGGKIQIVGLTGYLFEGVAINLGKYLKEVVRTTRGLETLILDFFACQGINDSACAHLIKLSKLLSSRNITLSLCNASTDDVKLLKNWKIESDFCRILDNLTAAVAQAESKILASHCAALETIRPQTTLGGPEKEELSRWLGEKATHALLGLGKLTIFGEGTGCGVQGDIVDSVFIAIPGFSDMQFEMQTGNSLRPAILLRTTRGAVCPPEALIKSSCRGTWRAQSTSVGVYVKDVDALIAFGDAFAPLLAAGLHQQLYQADQLSSRYTISRGGGWHGVTFDATTTLGAEEKVARTLGERQTSKLITTEMKNAMKAKGAEADRERPGLRPRQRSVNWEEAMHSVAAVIQPQVFRDVTLPSELFEHSDSNDDLNNLVLNRKTVNDAGALFASTGRAPKSESSKVGVTDLFKDDGDEGRISMESNRISVESQQSQASLREPFISTSAKDAPSPVNRRRSYSKSFSRALLTGDQNPLDMNINVRAPEMTPQADDNVDANL